MPGLRASTGCVRRVVNANLARKEPLASQHELLFWDAQNRLAEVQDANGNTQEQYGYDAGGARVKKTSGATATYTFFAHYEEEVTSGVTTAISHYSLGSLRIAVKRGSTLYHLHGDHLGSTSLTTSGSVVEASRTYYPYGAERAASGTLQTDRTFTGQKSDATGLLYYNARYYDPSLGTFISPDSLVPDAGMVVDYNRFLYARENPLKYSDPTGYTTEAVREWEAKNSWYNGRGWAWGGSHWNVRIGKRVFRSQQAAIDVWGDAGIAVDRSEWDLDNLKLLIEGIDRFALEIGRLFGLTGDVATRRGLERLKELTDGATSWHRLAYGYGLCSIDDPGACVIGSSVSFYDALFNSDKNYIRATAVHEMAHVIHNMSCHTVMGMGRSCTVQGGLILGVGYGLSGWGIHHITDYGNKNRWEYWAEAVADCVYEFAYRPFRGGQVARKRITGAQETYIKQLFNPLGQPPP